MVWLKTWLQPDIWVRVPLTEIHQGDFSPLFRYTLAIMLLAIGGAWLFIRIQNRPLVELEHAALQVGKGIIPPPLREYGASGSAVGDSRIQSDGVGRQAAGG